eukprot:TRINITY_DN13746_c0_g2_i1.p1 TRINITY_DN13746_c0_g2~~TRINITY_DN13746_c0_g2_i1.p1  ORF type:complete len:462 (+),score=75.58 TRINITY_DN13746_c0_g2_i1:33-1418(+)
MPTYFMLTHEQLNVLQSNEKIVFISGEYGTGKTFILKEKAKDFATKFPDKKILYLTMTTLNLHTESLLADGPEFDIEEYKKRLDVMEFMATIDFEDYQNIEVITMVQILEESKLSEEAKFQEMLPYLATKCRQMNFQYLFIDEVPVSNSMNFYKFHLDDLHEWLKDGGSLWLTFKTQDLLGDKIARITEEANEWLAEMRESWGVVDYSLRYNMRNSETVVRTANQLKTYGYQSFNESLRPEKTVQGPTCYCYNQGVDDARLVRAAILKYFANRTQDPIVVIVTGDEDQERVYEDLKESLPEDRNLVNLPRKNADGNELEIAKAYLKNPEGVLVTDVNNFHGAQARNIILYASGEEDLRNYILRCMSFIIVIDASRLKNAQMEKVEQGFVEDKDLHEFLPKDENYGGRIWHLDNEARGPFRLRSNDDTEINQMTVSTGQSEGAESYKEIGNRLLARLGCTIL